MSEEIKYYKTFEDDFVETANQSVGLPDDYVWVRTDFRGRASRALLYPLAILFAHIFARVYLHMSIVRNVDMHEFKDTGAMVYGNHTQPIGDAFTPVLACRPKRCYIVISPSNFGIPFIGKLLPTLGGLPIPTTYAEMKKFIKAVSTRLEEKNCVIVYPEAHVWPYYTDVRPFPSTAFSYAVSNHVPAFCMTSTYQDRGPKKNPKTTVYVDGPFYADPALSAREQRDDLRDQVYACMKERCRMSTSHYIEYLPAEEPDAAQAAGQDADQAQQPQAQGER